MLVHHGADVPLEVGEENTAGVDVLGLRGSLLLGAAVLFLDAGRRVAGEGAAGAAAALRGFLHFGVKGEFLGEGGRKQGKKIEPVRQSSAARYPGPLCASRDAEPSPLPRSSKLRCRSLVLGCPPCPSSTPYTLLAFLSYPGEATKGLPKGLRARAPEVPTRTKRSASAGPENEVPHKKHVGGSWGAAKGSRQGVGRRRLPIHCHSELAAGVMWGARKICPKDCPVTQSGEEKGRGEKEWQPQTHFRAKKSIFLASKKLQVFPRRLLCF